MRHCPLWRPRAEPGVAYAPEKGRLLSLGALVGYRWQKRGSTYGLSFASLPHLGLGRARAGVTENPQTDGTRRQEVSVCVASVGIHSV